MPSLFQACRIGLVATQCLNPGDLILEEEPFAVFQVLDTNEWGSIEAALQWARNLSNEDLESLSHIAWTTCGSQLDKTDVDLRSVVKEGRLESLGRLRDAMADHGFPYKSKRQDGWVLLCETVVRINHSCRPNTDASWDDTNHRLAIRAARGIEKGEEITLSYINEYCERSERWNRLGYECECEECSLKDEDLTQSDAEREQLGAFYDLAFKLRFKYDMRWNDAFTSTTDATARAIGRDPDIKAFLEMQRDLAKRSPPPSLYFAVAMHTIAVILCTGSRTAKWDHVAGALRFLDDTRQLYEMYLGAEHECTKTVVQQIEDVREQAGAHVEREL